ncbi:hypothetical protein ANCDUO_04141 [Ancylostoma duodenale]|uniref:Uncharacterized protein n=1 Tax=Ancylostoma duodenale TaxID=51022 RepID=A0A0C2H7W1_9BILA|nr:hypothetical protein ANCDUO_04141 [Ancylostoma duodenale]
MTVRDKTFVRFVNHPSMADVKNKSIFLHVCVPGQEDNAADYIGEYVAMLVRSTFSNFISKLESNYGIFCVHKRAAGAELVYFARQFAST